MSVELHWSKTGGKDLLHCFKTCTDGKGSSPEAPMPRDLVGLSSRAVRADRGTNGFAHGVTGITDMSTTQKALPRDNAEAALHVRAHRGEAGDRDESRDPAEGWRCPVTWHRCWLSGAEHHHHTKPFGEQHSWERAATLLPKSSH